MVYFQEALSHDHQKVACIIRAAGGTIFNSGASALLEKMNKQLDISQIRMCVKEIASTTSTTQNTMMSCRHCQYGSGYLNGRGLTAFDQVEFNRMVVVSCIRKLGDVAGVCDLYVTQMHTPLLFLNERVVQT